MNPRLNIVGKDADLLTCIDTTYTALIDAYQHRQELPDDIRRLLADAFIVLAVTRRRAATRLLAHNAASKVERSLT